MKKILIITQYFYPENFRINDMCIEWVNRGYDVTVLTGVPNYPKGEIYDGYKRKYKEEEWNKIHIVRLPMYPRGKNLLTLARNCFSFVYFGKKYIDKIVKNNNKFPYDLIFTFEVSPMTQALVGEYAKRKYKAKHLLYVQDLWPENVEELMGIRNPFVIKPIEKMVERIYNSCDYIFATSRSFVLDIQKRIDNNKEKVKYWPQYAEDFYVPKGKHISNNNVLNTKPFSIAFTGNIGTAQGLDILCESAKILKNKYNISEIDLKFIIVGDGKNANEFKNIIKKNQVENMFVFLGKKNPEEIPDILADIDYAFVSFKNCDLLKKTIPAKLQSYIACGMPVIASVEGETEKIINEGQFGYCSPLGDAELLAKNIITAKESKDIVEKSINARKYFEKNFTKKMLMDEMEKFFM